MSERLTEQEAARRMAAMLDQMMQGGCQHVRVQVDDVLGPVQVETTRSTECMGGDQACRIPTLHRGIDDEEQE